jgi:hypothetical protein
VYEKFSAETFPAVPAQETAVTSTCRASLKACPGTLGRMDPTIHCCRGTVARPRLRKIARRVVVNSGSRGAPANVTPPDAVQKTAMASCRTSLPLPTLGFTCTDPLAVECDVEMQRDRSTCRRPPDHHLQPNPRRTSFCPPRRRYRVGWIVLED